MVIEYFAPGFIYTLAKDGWNALRRKRRRLTPSEVVARRSKWKPLFEARVRESYREKFRRDVIVRDMKRIDTYPNIDEGKAICAWFRAGLVGTYHRGILLGLGWQTLTKVGDDGRWMKTSDLSAGQTGGIKVILLGRVTYESIENVDWNGDEFYPYPHIYCSFDHKGQPYEHVGYCTEHQNPGGPPYYTEVASYAAVAKSKLPKGGRNCG